MLVSQCEYRQAIQDTALGPRGIQSAVDATRHQGVVLQFSRLLAIELGGGAKLHPDAQWYTECLFQRVCRKLLTLRAAMTPTRCFGKTADARTFSFAEAKVAPLPSWVHDEGESSDDEGKSSGEKAEGQSSGAQGTGQSARRDRNSLLGKTQKKIIRRAPARVRKPKWVYLPGSKKACSICGKKVHPACFAQHESFCKSQR